MSALLKHLRPVLLLVAFALAVQPLPTLAQNGQRHIEISGQKHAVPVNPDLCHATDADLSDTKLSRLIVGKLAAKLSVRAVELDCSTLEAVRKGQRPKKGQMNLIFIARMGDGGLDFNTTRRLQFDAIHAVAQSSPDNQARQQFLDSITGSLARRDGQEVTCTGLEATRVAIGGEICLVRYRSSGPLKIDMAVSMKPIGNRLVGVMLANVNHHILDRPRFHEADAMLNAIQPVN